MVVYDHIAQAPKEQPHDQDAAVSMRRDAGLLENALRAEKEGPDLYDL